MQLILHYLVEMKLLKPSPFHQPRRPSQSHDKSIDRDNFK